MTTYKEDLFLDECLPAYMSLCAGAQGGQKRALDPLELELQTVVSHHAEAGFSFFSQSSSANDSSRVFSHSLSHSGELAAHGC